MRIKHSKYRNTGILFESLVKQITSDTLSGKSSPSLGILKKYFVNTELSKEYKLYEFLFKNTPSNEIKSKAVLDTILESSKNLNRTTLRKEKYNLIKELKKHYNIDTLLRNSIPNYRVYAALYTLMEIHNSSKPNDPTQVVDNKVTLLEFITKEPTKKKEVKNSLLREFENYDESLRLLTYQILLEKFNEKHSHLSDSQKRVLKEFIVSIDNTPNLREFYNSEVVKVRNKVRSNIKNVKDKVTRIKLEEVVKIINTIPKNSSPSNDDLVNLLQYYSLIDELKKISK